MQEFVDPPAYAPAAVVDALFEPVCHGINDPGSGPIHSPTNLLQLAIRNASARISIAGAE
jgi:hypothetical protein